MGIRIGTLSDERVAEAFRVFATALQLPVLDSAQFERRRSTFFLDRAVVAFDGDRIVGHAGDFPFETLLPGGRFVPTAGLSRVGVLASHRRRGVLTAMMGQQLRQARERGDVLGSLRAAEAAIYGRFGYGLAGLAGSVRVTTHRSAFQEPVTLPGRFEIMQGTALIAAARAAYERSLVRPGALRRPAWYWDLHAHQHAVEFPAVADWGVVHFDRRERPDGFARWETVDRDRWHELGHRIAVSDLHGADADVEAGLWRFVFDLDLVESVTCESRPLDDPVRHRLRDTRAFETTEVWDEQWVRVLDVAGALSARTYGTDETVVLEVTADPWFADNVARFEVGNEGCRRVRRAAELSMPVDMVGAVLLGGTSFGELVAARRIVERRPGAAARADRLFHAPLQPWCGTFF